MVEATINPISMSPTAASVSTTSAIPISEPAISAPTHMAVMMITHSAVKVRTVARGLGFRVRVRLSGYD